MLIKLGDCQTNYLYKCCPCHADAFYFSFFDIPTQPCVCEEYLVELKQLSEQGWLAFYLNNSDGLSENATNFTRLLLPHRFINLPITVLNAVIVKTMKKWALGQFCPFSNRLIGLASSSPTNWMTILYTTFYRIQQQRHTNITHFFYSTHILSHFIHAENQREFISIFLYFQIGKDITDRPNPNHTPNPSCNIIALTQLFRPKAAIGVSLLFSTINLTQILKTQIIDNITSTYFLFLKAEVKISFLRWKYVTWLLSSLGPQDLVPFSKYTT